MAEKNWRFLEDAKAKRDEAVAQLAKNAGLSEKQSDDDTRVGGPFVGNIPQEPYSGNIPQAPHRS